MKKQWEADISVTERLAAALIEDQFQELSPVSVQPIGEGWDNVVFGVNDTFVFRFPRRHVAVSCLEVENHVLPQLEPLLSLPVPNPVYIGSPSERYPYPFSGYAVLPGRAAHLARLNHGQRTQTAAAFAEFLRELHTLPMELARRMGAPGDTIGRMDVDMRIEKFDEYINAAKRNGLLDDDAGLRRILESLPRTGDIQSNFALVHGDLNFRNFLINDNGRLAGVIDWGDVHIGNPAVDLAIAHSFLPPQGRQIFRKVYGDIDDETWLLARFRALYTNLYILVYAHDVGDTAQFIEAKTALELTLIED